MKDSIYSVDGNVLESLRATPRSTTPATPPTPAEPRGPPPGFPASHNSAPLPVFPHLPEPSLNIVPNLNTHRIHRGGFIEPTSAPREHALPLRYQQATIESRALNSRNHQQNASLDLSTGGPGQFGLTGTPQLSHRRVLSMPFPMPLGETPQMTFRGPQSPLLAQRPQQQVPNLLDPQALASALEKMSMYRAETRNHIYQFPPRFPPGLPMPSPAPGPAQPSKFRPMAALAEIQRPADSNKALEVAPIESPTFSSNYRGEHSIRNASVAELSDNENCALWLTNLPPDVTPKELLGVIRNVGRIWCTVINAPDGIRHITAAAKVVFFTPQPAQQLLTQSVTRGLAIRGFPVKVTHNRVKYRQEPVVANASRVLIVTGKSSFVNEASLTSFFEARFLFQVDEVRSLIENAAGRSVVEFKFGSYRCQSQMGKMALEKDKPEGFEKVEFGEDPCEVGDTLSSYEIAGRRIVGRAD